MLTVKKYTNKSRVLKVYKKRIDQILVARRYTNLKCSNSSINSDFLNNKIDKINIFQKEIVCLFEVFDNANVPRERESKFFVDQFMDRNMTIIIVDTKATRKQQLKELKDNVRNTKAAMERQRRKTQFLTIAAKSSEDENETIEADNDFPIETYTSTFGFTGFV